MSSLLADDPQQAATDARPASFRARTMSAVAVAGFTITMLVGQLAQLFLRDPSWTIDTRWAISQYLFSMVLFTPLVAGLAAHQGRALGRASWLVRARPWRGLWTYAAPALIIPLAVFSGGVVAALAMAAMRGSPVELTASDLLGIAAALLGIVAHVAIGLCIGAWVRLRIVVPLAAALVFGVTMLAWIAGGRVLVDFGGATGGVIGLEVTTDAHLVRIAFMTTLLVLGIVATRAALGAWSARAWSVFTAALVAALVGAAGTSLAEGYQETSEDWTCQGTAPEVCVPTRLARLLPGLAEAVTNQGLAAQVVAAHPNAGQRMEVEDSLVLARVADIGPAAPQDPVVLESVGSLVYNELLAPGCLAGSVAPSELTGEEEAAWNEVVTWIWWQTSVPDPESAPMTASDLGVPDVQIGSPESTAFLAEKIGQLPACP